MFKRFFTQNLPIVGIVAGLGSMIVTALLITAMLIIVGDSASAHLSLYAGCFVPPILIMRYYVKKQFSIVVKTMIVLIFVLFIAFMFILFKTHSLNF